MTSCKPPLPLSRRLAGAAVLAALVAVVYWPAIHGGFVFDDDTLVTRSDVVQAADGLSRIWFTTQSIDYWPVTNTSFWIEWRLWGLDPTGYHITNMALHSMSAVLLWVILRSLGIPGAYLAALLFAVHPVNVASVAWIAQRKNTLSMVFFLLAVLWFLKDRYWLSVAAFTVAMLSKGSVAVFPGVVLLIIWWQRGTITRRDLLRVAPFVAIAAGLTVVNIWFQARATAIIRDATVTERIAAAGGIVWFYLGKALLPVRLLFMYPQDQIGRSWLPLLGAGAVTAGLWWYRSRPAIKAALFAWLFFVISLVPVLGLVDVYFMRYSLVADHYEYIALVAVVALAAAALYRLPRVASVAAGAVLVCGLGSLTWLQARTFADAEVLYRTTLAGNPAAWALHNNLGALLVDRGRDVEAAAFLREALRLRPGLVAAQKNLCLASTRLGRYEEAIAECSTALAQSPDYVDAHYHLGQLLVLTGRPAESIAHFQELLRARPDSALAHNAFGAALASVGRTREAAGEFRAALALQPDFGEAQSNLTKLSAEAPLR
jgi:tetratricopeptide (TPR) repeat protein